MQIKSKQRNTKNTLFVKIPENTSSIFVDSYLYWYASDKNIKTIVITSIRKPIGQTRFK